MNNDDTIHRRIVNARHAANLTQQQLADALQLPLSDVDDIESGIRPVSTLELAKLAQLLRTPIFSFVSGATFADLSNLGEELSVILQQKLDSIIVGGSLSISDETRTQLWDLALKAFQKEEISAGKLRDVGSLLGVSADAVSQLIANDQ